MATAEVAVALPALVLLVAAAMTAVSMVTAQLRCVDAAREAARAAARGEGATVVRSLAERSAPGGSVPGAVPGQRAARGDERRPVG